MLVVAAASKSSGFGARIGDGGCGDLGRLRPVTVLRHGMPRPCRATGPAHAPSRASERPPPPSHRSLRRPGGPRRDVPPAARASSRRCGAPAAPSALRTPARPRSPPRTDPPRPDRPPTAGRSRAPAAFRASTALRTSSNTASSAQPTATGGKRRNQDTNIRSPCQEALHTKALLHKRVGELQNPVDGRGPLIDWPLAQRES